MLEQISVSLPCVVQFTNAGTGATGLTVTCTVYFWGGSSWSTLVSSQSATEVGEGFYSYQLGSGSNTAEGLYLFVFSTAGTADLKKIGAGWAVSKAGVEFLDAAVTSRLAPTVAARTLDVSAGGEAGVDLANVGSPTTTLNLTGTTVAAVSGAAGSVTGNVGGNVVGSVASVVGNVGGNVAGSVASVTAGVTVTTNNDKTGYSLSAAAVQAVWDALTAALTTVGSIGRLLVTNIDALISSRLATLGYTAPDNTSVTAIKAKTDNLPAAPASTGDVTGAQTAILAKLPTALVGGRIDASVGAYPGNAAQTGDAFARLGAPTGVSVSADVAVVKTKTDQLTFTAPNKVDSTAIVSSFGTLVADIWSNVVRTLTSVSGVTSIVSPVGVAGTLALVRGDDYMDVDDRALAFTRDTWPDLTGAVIVMTWRHQTSDHVAFTLSDTTALRVVGSGSQTVVFEPTRSDTAELKPGAITGKYDIQATLLDGDVVTLELGLGTVYEDQTRP